MLRVLRLPDGFGTRSRCEQVGQRRVGERIARRCLRRVAGAAARVEGATCGWRMTCRGFTTRRWNAWLQHYRRQGNPTSGDNPQPERRRQGQTRFARRLRRPLTPPPASGVLVTMARTPSFPACKALHILSQATRADTITRRPWTSSQMAAGRTWAPSGARSTKREGKIDGPRSGGRKLRFSAETELDHAGGGARCATSKVLPRNHTGTRGQSASMLADPFVVSATVLQS